MTGRHPDRPPGSHRRSHPHHHRQRTSLISALIPVLVILGGLIAWALVVGAIQAFMRCASRANRRAEVIALLHQAVDAGRIGQADQLAAELSELRDVRRSDEELLADFERHLADR
jgi:hypothetical protein